MNGGRHRHHAKDEAHKATAKRFKITGSGRLFRLKQRRTHLRRRESKRVLGSLDKDVPVAGVDAKRVRQILGLRKAKRK